MPEGQEATAHLNISPLPRHLYPLYEKYVFEETRNKLTVHWAVQAAPLHGPLQWWLASAQHRLLSFSPSHLRKKKTLLVGVLKIGVSTITTYAPSLAELVPFLHDITVNIF